MSSLRPVSPPPEEGDDGDLLSDATWLYSWADLTTQLLLFAILTVTLTGIAAAKHDGKPSLDSTERELRQMAEDRGLGEAMAVDRSGDRVVVRLESLLLFPPGRADLNAEAVALLDQLGELFSPLPNRLRVEGHTDDVPISTAEFPSNWELSTSRAIAVVEHLESRGIVRRRLAAAGYGQYHPIVPNDSPRHRGKNRRVEIVIVGATTVTSEEPATESAVEPGTGTGP